VVAVAVVAVVAGVVAVVVAAVVAVVELTSFSLSSYSFQEQFVPSVQFCFVNFVECKFIEPQHLRSFKC